MLVLPPDRPSSGVRSVPQWTGLLRGPHEAGALPYGASVSIGEGVEGRRLIPGRISGAAPRQRADGSRPVDHEQRECYGHMYI